MTISLLKEIENRAPATQIHLDFTEDIDNKYPKKTGIPVPPPVDFKVQDLIKQSMLEENILKSDDLTWLPWM
jgi:hypothetical protein